MRYAIEYEHLEDELVTDIELRRHLSLDRNYRNYIIRKAQKNS